MTSSTDKGVRANLYRFLLSKPDAVRELLRQMSAAEAADLLDLLIQCDNRRVAKLSRPKPINTQAEMDAILDA